MKKHKRIIVSVLILALISCNTKTTVHLPAKSAPYSSVNSSEELKNCVSSSKEILDSFSSRRSYIVYYQLESNLEEQYDDSLWIINRYITVKPSKEIKYIENNILMNTTDQSIGVFNCENAIVIIVGLNTSTYTYQPLPEN